jgi:hypothetical protein
MCIQTRYIWSLYSFVCLCLNPGFIYSGRHRSCMHGSSSQPLDPSTGGEREEVSWIRIFVVVTVWSLWSDLMDRWSLSTYSRPTRMDRLSSDLPTIQSGEGTICCMSTACMLGTQDHCHMTTWTLVPYHCISTVHLLCVQVTNNGRRPRQSGSYIWRHTTSSRPVSVNIYLVPV